MSIRLCIRLILEQQGSFHPHRNSKCVLYRVFGTKKENQMPTICKIGQSLLFCALLMLSIAACGGAGSGAANNQTIVIGATLPLTGPLAAVGVILKAGYQAAVNDANATGAVKVNGTAQK